MSRIAVVTGASRGLGRITALHLARQSWRVAMTARNKFVVDSPDAACVIADVASPTSMHDCAQQTLSALGPASLLVCNAAVLGPVGRITDCDSDEFESALRTNIVGVVNTIRAYWSQLQQTQHGRIIVVSGGGTGGPRPMLRAPAYVPSKAAVGALVEVLAPECAEIGAAIIAVAPGAVIPSEFLAGVSSYPTDVAGESLVNEAVTQRAAKESAADGYLHLLDYLAGDAGAHLNGALLSGRWNTPEQLNTLITSGITSNMYRLRRVDGDLFFEH